MVLCLTTREVRVMLLVGHWVRLSRLAAIIRQVIVETLYLFQPPFNVDQFADLLRVPCSKKKAFLTSTSIKAGSIYRI